MCAVQDVARACVDSLLSCHNMSYVQTKVTQQQASCSNTAWHYGNHIGTNGTQDGDQSHSVADCSSLVSCGISLFLRLFLICLQCSSSSISSHTLAPYASIQMSSDVSSHVYD